MATFNFKSITDKIKPEAEKLVTERVRKGLTKEEWAQVKVSSTPTGVGFTAPPEIKEKIAVILRPDAAPKK
jgi:hypothetical protein